MYVQRSRLLRILSPHSFSVYLATCWQKYPISFTANFTEKVGACAFSVYQALAPPLKGPGDEATGAPTDIPPNSKLLFEVESIGVWLNVDVSLMSLITRNVTLYRTLFTHAQ